MKAFLLVLLLSTSAIRWDGTLWREMNSETKLAYAGGYMGGLAVAAYLKDDPLLQIRKVGPDWIVTSLDIFYLSPSNRNVPIADAIMLLGGKEKPDALRF